MRLPLVVPPDTLFTTSPPCETDEGLSGSCLVTPPDRPIATSPLRDISGCPWGLRLAVPPDGPLTTPPLRDIGEGLSGPCFASPTDPLLTTSPSRDNGGHSLRLSLAAPPDHPLTTSPSCSTERCWSRMDWPRPLKLPSLHCIRTISAGAGRDYGWLHPLTPSLPHSLRATLANTTRDHTITA